MNKTTLRLLILLGVLALLVGSYFLIRALTPAEEPDEPSDAMRYEPVEGEDTNANRLYPVVTYEGSTKTALTLDVLIRGEKGTYGIYKAENDSTFYFYTIDDEGEQQIYYPPIADVDPNFNYTDLYATEDMGLGLGLPRVMYLAVSAGNIAFTERIPLSEDEEERQAQLQTYGLLDAKNVMSLQYKNKAERQVRHTVTVGDLTPGNNGYYCLVDDRPYVYATSTDSLQYILQPFAYYVSPALIAPGTQGQSYSQFEAYVTVSFREFVNRVYKDSTVEIPTDAKVLVTGRKRTAADEAYDAWTTLEFNLKTLSEDKAFDRLVTMLTRERVGDVSLLFTQQLPLEESRRLLFTDTDTRAYTYTVTRVDALLRESTEVTGGTVGDDTVLKISYTCQKDDDPTLLTSQGILDLSVAPLDAETRAALAALPVGEDLSASEQVRFTVNYTKDTSDQRYLHMTVDEILAIFDTEGNSLDTVTDESVIYCRYHYTIEGKDTSPIVGVLDLSKTTGDYGDSLREKLVGQGIGSELDLTVYTYIEQYELIYSYEEYEVSEILSFVVEEEIVAFGFENEEDRDPFYRETYFSNQLPKGHPYRLYGLNDTICQAVIRALGGIQEDATKAAGLFGSETVAIGLTPTLLEEYGLYANTVYLEVPRGITTVTTASGATEFRWLYTLPFTMLISDVKYDPDTGEAFRYVASDLYDIVVRIDADTFSFLEYSFVDYWARETMLMVDLSDIQSLKVETFLDDFSGSYDFRVQLLNVPMSDGTTYEWRRINVLVGEGCTHESLLAYMAQASGKELQQTDDGALLNLNYIYDHAWGVTDATYGKNYAGDGYFREWLESLYYVGYGGVLTEEEQAAYLQTDMLMRMTLDLEGKANDYVFEFYRGTDRRVMVRMYQVNDDGVMQGAAVQDFYISTYGFKKIVGGVNAMLSGVAITGADGYIDVP